MAAVLALVAMLICSSFATAQTQMPDKRLVSDADFRAVLSQVDATLSALVARLKSIDLDKAPQISYSRGKSIEAQRDLGLMEIDIVRKEISQLGAKRSVSGELTSEESLDTFFNSIALPRTSST